MKSVGWQALAVRGADVTLTDNAIMLPLMRQNVSANFGKEGNACVCYSKSAEPEAYDAW